MRNSINRIAFIIVILPLLFGCSFTHFVGSMKNYDQEQDQTEDSLYAFKNDTIGVSHAFNERNGRIRVRIENFTNKPMLINLSKSVLTINGESKGFLDGKSMVSGRFNQFGTAEFGSSGIYNGEISSQPMTFYIPPQTFAQSTFTDIYPDVKKVVNEDINAEWGNYPLFDDYELMKIEFFRYENTPLKMTSFVNYSLLDENNLPEKTNIVKQNFYLSSFARMKNRNWNKFRAKLDNHEDMYGYTRVRHQYLQLGLFLGGLLILVVALGPAE